MRPAPLSRGVWFHLSRSRRRLLRRATAMLDQRGCGWYYDRAGRPIGLGTWAILIDIDDYKIVRQTQIGGALVSTIWLGLDYGGTRRRRLIFETMVFGPLDAVVLGERYSTEGEARRGHRAAVAAVRREAASQ